MAEEISRCVSEDEFNRRMPHTVTVLGRQGNGQCNLKMGWEEDCDFDLECDDTVKALENAGYDVELVP